MRGMRRLVPSVDRLATSPLFQELERHNPILAPKELQRVIADYRDFSPFPGLEKRVFAPLRAEKKLAQILKNQSRFVVALSGPSAAGKDDVRSRLEKLFPGVTAMIVTSTTRPIRLESGEKEGETYFFLSSDEFVAQKRRGEFVESNEVHPGVFYGLSLSNLMAAFQKAADMFTIHTEIGGWDKLEKAVEKLGLPLVRVYLMPAIPFRQYEDWLRNHRLDQYADRVAKTVDELRDVPKKADFLVLNPLRPERAAAEIEATARALGTLFSLSGRKA